MKLKTIKPTSEYKHILLGDIKDDWQGRKIYTPNGFKEIKNFFFTKKNRTLIINLDNGMSLVCDPEHKLLTTSGEKLANELNNTDKLIGYNGLVSFSTEAGPVEELYDISIDNPHWYYTSGVTSHNSIVICNNAAACFRMGLKVLHITCELSWYKTACRYCGILTRTNINTRFEHKDFIIDTMKKVKKTFGGDLAIYEYPPDMITIRTISSLVDQLKKTRNWKPDVIAIDYLELLLADNQYFNQDEYKRQKKVSTEIRQLAKTTGTYIITATQTNRATKQDGKVIQEDVIDLNRVSESFGKMMPADYVVSINQTRSEYGEFKPGEKKDEQNHDSQLVDKKKEKSLPAKLRLYIAKNRNGPKFKTVSTLVNFNNMFMKEITEEVNNV